MSELTQGSKKKERSQHDEPLGNFLPSVNSLSAPTKFFNYASWVNLNVSITLLQSVYNVTVRLYHVGRPLEEVTRLAEPILILNELTSPHITADLLIENGQSKVDLGRTIRFVSCSRFIILISYQECLCDNGFFPLPDSDSDSDSDSTWIPNPMAT